MTREDSGVLCFHSRRGVTHQVRLECDPDIPVAPGEEHYVLEVPNMLLEISGEITPERIKGWSQSKNNTQLWM